MRRDVIVLLSALVTFLVANMGAPQQLTLQQVRDARKEAAHRQRRIIFNNDGNEPVYYCKEATAEELLSKRTSPLLGSQVDSVFYCTWSSGFGMFTHHTKIGQVFTTTNGVFERNLTKEFLERGLDPLQVMVDFCKEHGIEIFWSMRMNDVHDGGYPDMVPQWKHEHPEYLFGTLKKKPPAIRDGRAWSAVDYGRTAVRERAFRFIEEVCRNYDVDGIEMDFFRHPVYFKKLAWGQPLTQTDLDIMTGFVRRVRRMTEGIALERGRPILVAARTPDSVEYCRQIGLDLERWMKDGLIDIWAPSGYFHLTPWEESVALGHRYGVMVYPCLSESRMKGKAGSDRNRLESRRARAMNVWNSGADGVYMFNFFDPRSPLWRQIGDPQQLRKLDKVYYVAYRGLWAADAYLPGGSRFVKLPTLSPERPEKLQPGKTLSVPLTVGENVLWGKAQGIVPEVTLGLQVTGLPDPTQLTVKVNGEAVGIGRENNEWIEYQLAPEQVKQGANRFDISLSAVSSTQASVQDLRLIVDYPESL